MQDKILEVLKKVITPYGIPAPVDLRQGLATNPSGKQWKLRNANNLKGMVWHQALANGPVEAIAHYHTGPDSHLYPGGVESIAYTFAIRKDGQIILCNDLNKSTWSHGTKAHVGDENAEYIAVLFEGFLKGEGVTDSDASEPTLDQILSGITLWKVLKALYKWDDSALLGHSFFGKPACPGAALDTVIACAQGSQGVSSDLHTKEDVVDKEVVESIDSSQEESIDTPIEADTAIQTENEQYKQFRLDTIEDRQQALKALGYYRGAIDGNWGPKSSAAFTFFQNNEGITVDGIWGPQSQNAMNMALNKIL